jgi:hypothetical protein
MKVAYIFTTSGHTASYKLGQMILPQLEANGHGAEFVAMMFFDDNTFLLRRAIRRASGSRRSPRR